MGFVGGGEVRVLEDLADARRASVREVGGRRVGPLRQGEGRAGPLPLDDLAHREAAAGVGDGRRQRVGELQRPEPLQQLVPAIDRARHRPRQGSLARHPRVTLPDQRLAVDLVRRAAGRVQPVELLGLGVPEDGEQVAADAVHVRLDQPEDGVDRHRGVYRVAAGLEDVDAHLRRQRLAGRHHAVRGDDLGAAAVRAPGRPAVAVPQRILRLGAHRHVAAENRDSKHRSYRHQGNPTAPD